MPRGTVVACARREAAAAHTWSVIASPPNKIATTNGHWVQTNMDGFGGTGQPLFSEVSTVYVSCGCSPIGKVVDTLYKYDSGGEGKVLSVGESVDVFDSAGETDPQDIGGMWGPAKHGRYGDADQKSVNLQSLRDAAFIARNERWLNQGIAYLRTWTPRAVDTDCNADLHNLGLTPAMIQSYATNGPFPMIPIDPSIFQFMITNNADFAVTTGTQIFYQNPSSFIETSFAQMLGALVHEYGHLAGDTDAQEAADVNVVYDSQNTWYISNRLMRDCFSGVPNP